MIKIKQIVAGIILALGMMPGVGVAEAKLFGGQEFFLENGMQVIVIPNHKAPIIKHMVFYKSGGVDEAPGKGGSAHLLEHLMFRGTSEIKGNSLNKILEENGAESNAFTSLEVTAYHQALDISRLELAMFLEADRMQNLKLTPKDFALERDIVFQERKQVVENNPISYFNESMRRTLWQDHPFARPITGTVDEIKNLKFEDVQDFYNQYYAPNNAILILSGDIDVETAKTLAQKYYGPVKPRKMGKKIEFPVLEPSMQASLKMSRPHINGERIMLSYAAPSYNVNAEDIYDLAVWSAYLGEGSTSKLYKKLVMDKKLALKASSSYDANSRSYGTFSINLIPALGVDSEQLLAQLEEAVEESLQEMTVDEVEKTKQKMLAGLIYLKDNPNDAAYIVGMQAAIGMSLQDIENQADKIKAVDAKKIKNSVLRLLKNTPKITGVLQPEEKTK